MGLASFTVLLLYSLVMNFRRPLETERAILSSGDVKVTVNTMKKEWEVEVKIHTLLTSTEVSSQLKSTTDSLPVSIKYEAEWVPEMVSTLWRKKSLLRTGNKSMISASSLDTKVTQLSPLTIQTAAVPKHDRDTGYLD